MAYCGEGESWVVELFSSQSPGRGRAMVLEMERRETDVRPS